MRNLTSRLVKRICRSQAGFTLAELLVVVGIIVALAAVIIPTVTKFTGKGDQGAQSSEKENVQSAFDAMMTDKGITTVTALAGPTLSTNAWTALPAGTGAVPLNGYLRSDNTKYYYCYDATGKVTRQDTAATACP